MGTQVQRTVRGKRALDFVEAARPRVEVVGVEQAAREYASGQALVLDVREPHEWATGHIPGALHIPRGELEFMSDPTFPLYKEQIASKDRILVHCAKGLRSILAAATLQEMGYNVASIDGGIEAWRAAGQPVETAEAAGR